MRHQEKTKRGIEALLCAALLACGIARAQTNRYVRWNNPSPSPGYLTWAAAATNINDAIDAASVGDTIWVTNGTYDTGERAAGGRTNRVYINKAVIVRSVNGPDYTFISGRRGSGGYGTDPDAIRGLHMTNGGTISGFTITNGYNQTGGGVWCGGTNDILLNCVIAINTANNGGGLYGGTLYNGTVINNRGINWAGGAYNTTLNNCLLTGNSGNSAGGTRNCILYNCIVTNNYADCCDGVLHGGEAYNTVISGNRARRSGGGAYSVTLYNCLVSRNTSCSNNDKDGNGGGAYGGALYNCTVAQNYARGVAATRGWGGGVYGGTVVNSVVFHNSAEKPASSNYWGNSNFVFSCTAPLPDGEGNTNADPQLKDMDGGDYRLRRGSPCINTGTNFDWMTDAADPRSRDLDGAFRINFPGATVDMGAYEFIPKGTTFMLRGQ